MVAVGGKGRCNWCAAYLSWRCQNTGLGEGIQGEENIPVLLVHCLGSVFEIDSCVASPKKVKGCAE